MGYVMALYIHDLRYCFYNLCVYLCIQYSTLSNCMAFPYSVVFRVCTVGTLYVRDMKIFVLIVGGCVMLMFFLSWNCFKFLPLQIQVQVIRKWL
jgi:hypothetical protein